MSRLIIESDVSGATICPLCAPTPSEIATVTIVLGLHAIYQSTDCLTTRIS